MIDPRDTDPLHVEEDRRAAYDRRDWRWIACAVAVIAALSFLAGRTSAAPRAVQLPTVPVTDAGQLGAPLDAGRKSLWATEAAAGMSSAGTGGAPTSAPATDLPPSSATSGIASYVAQRFGPLYLALPEGPGSRVRICGGGRCVNRTSTDAGPSLSMQRQGRVADLSWWDFQTLCQCRPESVGLVRVTVERLGRPDLTPPPTDR